MLHNTFPPRSNSAPKPLTATLMQEVITISVATLLLWKSPRFRDKKTLDSQKYTRLQKLTYKQWKCPENALQCQT